MTGNSNSAVLRQTISLVRPALECAADELWSHPRLQELYPELLFLLYSLIRTSVPLMEAAAAQARLRSRHDGVSRRLAQYLERHIVEEAGHDILVLDDLAILGLEPQAVRGRLPSAAAAAAVGAQYYWINHVHPVAVMGYIGVMEGRPPRRDALEQIIARSGLPRDAFSMYFKHADLDPVHCAEFDEALDRMPLEPDHTELLGVSGIETVHFLTICFRELVASCERAHSMLGRHAIAG